MKRFPALLLPLVLLVLLPVAAMASLGGDAASVERDRALLHSKRHQSTPTASYTVHSLQLPTGTTVKEFLNAAGTVFAVSWSGPFPPNLQQLFGDSYFQRYRSAALARPGRHPVHMRESDLMVDVNGHTGVFSGHAWLPGLLPAGVAGSDTQ